MTPVLMFLVQTCIILALPLAVFRLLRLQGIVPIVIVQIVVGILLGPSFFGRFAPDLSHQLFNPVSLNSLSGIASIAVLLFCFTTGLHLDASAFKGRGPHVAIVAIASVITPTLLGCVAGYWVVHRFPQEIGPQSSATQLVLAFG